MANNKCIVLGGSFNPPTIAHERLMKHAMYHTRAGFGIFVPSSHNYVARKMAKAKSDANILFSEYNRREMLLAITNSYPQPQLSVSCNEYGDDGHGHTFDTMEFLRKEDPTKRYYFLLGADKLWILPKWHNIEEFLKKFGFVVTSRSSNNARVMIESNPLLSRYSDRFKIIPEMLGMADISSTSVRQMLWNDDLKGAAKMLNPAVLDICVNVLKSK